jgi:hypothetical protein
VGDDLESVTSPMGSRTELESVSPDLAGAVPLRRGMLLAGRYEIQKAIGRGGMGLVVRAIDRALGEAVAIKIVRAEFAGQRLWTERLAREVKLARQIHHPNVCRVFDFEQADGRVFLVMELAAGGTLRNELQGDVIRRRPLSARLADAHAITAGLAAIHDSGIVHRDLSPQNVLRMSDGRLVLSDFGLATDSCDNSTSVHGGTVAYMAPEVVRGGHASFASDVWALGVVMHEAVFGVRPRWRDVGSFELLEPELGRRLEAPERAVLATCRVCLAAEPSRRPPRACEVARQLTETRRRWGREARRWSRKGVAAAASVATLAAAMAAGGLMRGRGVEPAAHAATIALVPAGTPTDWTDASRLLARIDRRFHCVTVLPDRRTVRFVWGTPRQAEDVDSMTGARVPSSLVAPAYAEGCPELSPDGHRLLYPGHTAEGRAAAFVSAFADGHDAVPVVSINEPTHASEPTWLPDGTGFSFDIDTRHMGVYSLASARAAVLPEPTSEPHVSANRHVTSKHLFISAWLDSTTTEVSGYGYPALTEELRFHLPEYLADWRADDAGSGYFATLTYSAPAHVFVVDLKTKVARRLGFIRDQFVERLDVLDGGLLIAGYTLSTRVTFKDPRRGVVELPHAGVVFDAARCGRDFLLTEQRGNGFLVERVDREGRVLANLTSGPSEWYVACAPDGRVWFYSSVGRDPGLWRCDGSGCRQVVAGQTFFVSVSPDAKRVAYLVVDTRGPRVRWLPLDGGPGRDVAETETVCGARWSSAETLWVSRRLHGRLQWIEMNADTGEATGRTSAGTSDCSDGWADPETPDADVQVLAEKRTELRVVPAGYLPGSAN